MQVKFWRTSLRFWFLLSYLIITVPLKSLPVEQSIICKELNWITALPYSLIVSTEPGLKSNSTTLWGINASADPISCPSKRALTVPDTWQFPKSSLARPEPIKVVAIDPTSWLLPHPYQFLQSPCCVVQTPSLQAIVHPSTVFVDVDSRRLLRCALSLQAEDPKT